MDTQKGFSSGVAMRTHFIWNDCWAEKSGENAQYFRIKPHSIVILRGNFFKQHKLK
jgi:hypothetical protein